MKRPLLAAALLAVLPITGASDAPATLETLVVTATDHPLPRERTAAELIVIDRAQIAAAMAPDIASLLRRFAGIDIGRTGGPGAQTSLFVRGGNSNHLLVLVDGVPINSGTTGAAALQHIDPDLIERIEVLKGPRASLYGSSAVAGVIQVFTRAGRPGQAELAARIGAFGSSEAELSAGFSDRRGATLSVAVSTQRVDRYRPRSDSPIERDYSQSGATLRGTMPVGEATLRASLWHSQAQVGYLDFTGTVPLDQDTANRSATIGVDLAPGPWTLAVDLQSMKDEIVQRDSADYARTRRHTVAAQLARALGARDRVTLDLSWTDEDLRALAGSGFGATPVAERRDHLAAGLHWLHSGEHLDLQALLAHEEHEIFDAPLLWNLDAAWHLGDRWSLLALAGTGFRAPTVLDRFGFGGNPSLEPERSRSLELGLRWQPDASARAELRLFENRVEDLVTFDLGSFTLQNIEQARTRGAELSTAMQLGHWRADANLFVQEPENRSTGQRLLRRSRTGGGLSLSGAAGRVHFGVELIARGARSDFGGARLGGYGLLNANASLDLGEGWRMALRVENLLDKDYQTAAGFREPGSSAWLEMRWSPRRL